MERGKFKSHKRIIGKALREPGAHMYHAATGVAGSKAVAPKRHKMKKAFARMRDHMVKRDEGTHHYAI